MGKGGGRESGLTLCYLALVLHMLLFADVFRQTQGNGEPFYLRIHQMFALKNWK